MDDYTFFVIFFYLCKSDKINEAGGYFLIIGYTFRIVFNTCLYYKESNIYFAYPV